jgi:APA family basic amino acid/polyamine antiporter
MQTEHEHKHTHLRRSLGLWSATAISVGATIGAGIFVVIGIVAGLAGSALVISMVLAGVIALFTALSFAELAAWKPVEGSIYQYTRQLVSPFAGFLTGWMWMVSNTFGGATVALGFAYYLGWAFPALPANIVAAAMCLGFTALNFVGIRQSAWLNNVLVVVNLVVLAFFIIFGSMFVHTGNFAPFQPLNGGVFLGAFFIFFAYGGFARVAVVAEEVQDAKRTVPKAILLSLGISMAFYILVGVVAVGLVGSSVLAASNSPLTAAMNATHSNLALQIVSVGGLVATAGVLLTSVLGVSRVAFAMAREKDMPKVFGEIHPRFGTPYCSILFVGLVMTGLALFVPLSHVAAISTFALLFYYSWANVCAIKLQPQDRLYPKAISATGLGLCLVLLVVVVFASWQAWAIGVSCLAIGVVMYAVKTRLKTGLGAEKVGVQKQQEASLGN